MYTTSLFICIKYINSGEVFLQAIPANLCQSSKRSFEFNNLWLLCLIMLLPQSFMLTIHIFFHFLLVLKWALMSLGAFIVSLKHNSSGKLCNPVNTVRKCFVLWCSHIYTAVYHNHSFHAKSNFLNFLFHANCLFEILNETVTLAICQLLFSPVNRLYVTSIIARYCLCWCHCTTKVCQEHQQVPFISFSLSLATKLFHLLQF